MVIQLKSTYIYSPAMHVTVNNWTNDTSMLSMKTLSYFLFLYRLTHLVWKESKSTIFLKLRKWIVCKILNLYKLKVTNHTHTHTTHTHTHIHIYNARNTFYSTYFSHGRRLWRKSFPDPSAIRRSDYVKLVRRFCLDMLLLIYCSHIGLVYLLFYTYWFETDTAYIGGSFIIRNHSKLR